MPTLGGVGLLFTSFLDSSFVPLPLVTDLILMGLCNRHPLRTPYYAAMAALGSLAGCIWIYWLARKGGEAYFRKRDGNPSRIHRFIQKYPMSSVFFPAVAPFPVPFKPFVLAQGVYQVPFPTFVIGTFVGRGILFFAEGFLAARYGSAAKQFLIEQKWVAPVVILGLILTYLLIRQVPLFRKSSEDAPQPDQVG